METLELLDFRIEFSPNRENPEEIRFVSKGPRRIQAGCVLLMLSLLFFGVVSLGIETAMEFFFGKQRISVGTAAGFAVLMIVCCFGLFVARLILSATFPRKLEIDPAGSCAILHSFLTQPKRAPLNQIEKILAQPREAGETPSSAFDIRFLIIRSHGKPIEIVHSEWWSLIRQKKARPEEIEQLGQILSSVLGCPFESRCSQILESAD